MRKLTKGKVHLYDEFSQKTGFWVETVNTKNFSKFTIKKLGDKNEKSS